MATGRINQVSIIHFYLLLPILSLFLSHNSWWVTRIGGTEKIGEMIDLIDWSDWDVKLSLSLSLLCTEEEEEVEFLFHLTNRWLPINAPRLLRIGSVSLVLFSLSSLSVLRRRRRSRSDTEHWRCKGKLTSLLLFVRERARAWDDVSTLHWNTFLTTSQVELVRLLLLMMLLLLLQQQQQQQVVNHQHMVFSVCCLFASLVSFFSFSFIERERDMIQYNANLSSFQLVTYQ